MLGAIARKIFGSANDREVKALRATVEQINALEPEVEKLSDDELRARIPDDLGYAGLRFMHELDTPGKLDEIASFLGASYFRALGGGQHRVRPRQQ